MQYLHLKMRGLPVPVRARRILLANLFRFRVPVEAIFALCAAPRGIIESTVRAQVGRAILALQTQNGRFNRVQFLAQFTEYSFHIHIGVLCTAWASRRHY